MQSRTGPDGRDPRHPLRAFGDINAESRKFNNRQTGGVLPQYVPGALNAVRVCLNVHQGDRVMVIKTGARRDIAEAIEEEAEAAGADVQSVVMEEVVARPAREFPRALAEGIRAFLPTVSYFVGEGLPGELAFRQPMLDLLVGELRCRHGHMIGIDRRVMQDGMAGDYEAIYRVTRKVWEIARQAERIEVTTPLGIGFIQAFNEGLRWHSPGSDWTQSIVFSILILILVFRPEGLLGERTPEGA